MTTASPAQASAMSQRAVRRPSRWVFAVIGLLALYGAHRALLERVREAIDSGGRIYSDDPKPFAAPAALDAAPSPAAVRAVAFEEIDAFDSDAADWSSLSSHYVSGVLVFDANGDGRLDVYFCQDGQNWTRPTDEAGVLVDEPRRQHNALFLNQGNDDEGRPLFVQAKELARANKTFTREELLIEDSLFPRSSPEELENRPGRQSVVALAADFNGDGRQDLLVGNAMPGMIWSHPTTQHVLSPFISPEGRKSKYEKVSLPAQGLAFIDYTPRLDEAGRRVSARGDEALAANSLYLNLGDRDGDGLPEWHDVSRSAGIEGSLNTTSLSVADIDLDGDLDLLVGNVMDADFFPIGAKAWAGGANELYVNQLADTGELRFIESAAAMDLDGVYDDENPMPDYFRLRRVPWLPAEYSFVFLKYEAYQPGFLQINGEEGGRGQISWATVMQDVDLDGFPDFWVANDMGFLRWYRNIEGRRFEATPHVASRTSGNWMSLAAADFDGDLEEDLFAGNLGGAVFSHAFPRSNPFALFDPTIESATASSMFINGMHDTRHVIVRGGAPSSQLRPKVRHSSVLPPDAALPNNIRGFRSIPNDLPFDADGLDPYEFTWGATTFDVDNDGALDLYYIGCLYGRGGGLAAILGTGPGRLLVNRWDEGDGVHFEDLTAEYQLFNIHELQYDRLADDGYVYRRSPSKNWQKRELVYSYDRSSWALQGPEIQRKISNQDLIQTAENGKGAIAADLNGDGFADLLVRNSGGYDSRSSTATNLKTRRDGRELVVPAHNYFFPVPTEYEPGSSRLFVNRHHENRWLRVRLVDPSPGSFNRNAVGARVIVNARRLRVHRAGSGSFVSNARDDLHFGLGADGVARSVVVHWPDRERTVTRLELPDLSDGTLTIDKSDGRVHWMPSGSRSEQPIVAPAL
ncbi:MAG: CRTAC1 family protein [Acidobacteriota bacterium]